MYSFLPQLCVVSMFIRRCKSQLLMKYYLCAGVSYLKNFSNRPFCLIISALWFNTSALQVAIDDDGTTFGNCLDGMGNSFPSGVSFLLVIGWKYFKIPCPDISDKPWQNSKLYPIKYEILKFSKCKILVGKILTIQHLYIFVKFVRLSTVKALCYSSYMAWYNIPICIYVELALI